MVFKFNPLEVDAFEKRIIELEQQVADLCENVDDEINYWKMRAEAAERALFLSANE